MIFEFIAIMRENTRSAQGVFNLRQVLKVFRGQKLYVKIEKYELFTLQLTFLGHYAQDIPVDQSNIEAIQS